MAVIGAVVVAEAVFVDVVVIAVGVSVGVGVGGWSCLPKLLWATFLVIDVASSGRRCSGVYLYLWLQWSTL